MKTTSPNSPNARAKMPTRTQVRPGEEEEEGCGELWMGLVVVGAAAARGEGVVAGWEGIGEGGRGDDDEDDIIGSMVASRVELLVGIVLVGCVEVVVGIESVLEVMGAAGVAEVMAVMNAVGVSGVAGGCMLVAGSRL
jgi:hypothetical protein